MNYDLERFIKAQENDYETALSEIRKGRKESHWMWYIFPQLKGLGFSEISEYFGIENIVHAKEYIENEYLRNNLLEITEALLNLDGDIEEILGYPDNLKLQSCMTLFSIVFENSIFEDVIKKFYGGKLDNRTLDMLHIKRYTIGN